MDTRRLTQYRDRAVCCICSRALKLGDSVVSRKSTNGFFLYHEECAKEVNLL